MPKLLFARQCDVRPKIPGRPHAFSSASVCSDDVSGSDQRWEVGRAL